VLFSSPCQRQGELLPSLVVHRPLTFRIWFIWQRGFGGEDLLKLANQKQELPVAAMFVNGLG
jgi:hypothetical protein